MNGTSYLVFDKAKVKLACKEIVASVDEHREEKRASILSKCKFLFKADKFPWFKYRNPETWEEYLNASGSYAFDPEWTYEDQYNFCKRMIEMIETSPIGIKNVNITVSDYNYIKGWM